MSTQYLIHIKQKLHKQISKIFSKSKIKAVISQSGKKRKEFTESTKAKFSPLLFLVCSSHRLHDFTPWTWGQ